MVSVVVIPEGEVLVEVRYRYFPGCTVKGQAKTMEDAAIAAAAALGIKLEELPQWQCCGAVFPLYDDESISLLSPVRALVAAESLPLVSLCAACHHVLKRAQEMMRRNRCARERVTGFLGADYAGAGRVLHYLELLRDDYGFDRLKEKIQHSLHGRKIAAYYGCLLLRPPKVMQFDDPENPTIMEDFLSALGAKPVISPYRVECCGSYLSVTEEQVASDTADRIFLSMHAAGADCIITACPLCRHNLVNCAGDRSRLLPVYYFSELLAEALGLADGLTVKEVAPR